MSIATLIVAGLVSYLIVGGFTYCLMCRALRVKKPGYRFIRNCLLAWPVVGVYAGGAVILIGFQSLFGLDGKNTAEEQQ